MIVREQILKEHSLRNAELIADYATKCDEHFRELIECFISSDYRVAQRAAWALSIAVTTAPQLGERYLTTLVAQLPRKDVHPAVIRNTVRILQDLNIPEEFHGEVMHACFGFIENPATPAAIKAFSLTTLYNLSKYYPDIRSELQLIIEERFETETPAFKSRARKILAQLIGKMK